MDFDSIYAHGFARVAGCTTRTHIADPQANLRATLDVAKECHKQGVALAVFPELGLSGYAIEDLLLADPLLDAVEQAVADLVKASRTLLPVLVVGAPLRKGNRLYNCAVVVHRGQLLGVVPKSNLPNYREFYERRHFAPGDDQVGEWITLAGEDVPFGPDLIFQAADLPDLRLHVEICEDMWVPIPPSAHAALAGATVLANLSGSPITIGKSRERHMLADAASTRCLAAYIYAAAGDGESTTDLSWDGQTMIHELGTLLAETERFVDGADLAVADVDLGTIVQERLRQGSFDDNRRTHAAKVDEFRYIEFVLKPPRRNLGLKRTLERFPFVPSDPAQLALDCYEAYNIQVSGIEQRLQGIATATWQPKIVIGVSGGLDSTHALLVAVQAMDRLGRSRKDILAFTMPGFATSEHTKNNAIALCKALGVTIETLDITGAAEQMLAGMGHPYAAGKRTRDVYDVTFENVQAGLRTDYLFRLANQRGGIVLGTADLSELALGWCTYGVGDQMSHYNVNGGVPKTLMQHLIRWVISSEQFAPKVGKVLQSILDTEISPELIPTAKGEKPQSTQDTIGPYALHDFTLWHLLRQGMGPGKIAFLAQHAWSDVAAGTWPAGFPEAERVAYDLPTIRRWLEVFIKRFFANQFKRSAMPNGPKVSSGGSLSPRGDWRMPSDALGTIWLAELDRDVPTG